MSHTCRDVEASIARPRQLLGEAERLVLEQHLSECARCRRVSDLSTVVSTMVLAAPSALGERSRERAISAALAATQSPAASVMTAASRPVRVTFWLAAAAVVLLGVGVALRPSAELASQQPVRTEPPASAPVVPAPEPAQPSWLENSAQAAHQFAHARVVSSAGARLRFVETTRTLELSRGQVDVDVDPSKHLSFEVRTQAFRVQVLGTQFVVSPEHVEVRHGHVRVLDSAGAELADLHDGASFDFPATRAASEPRAARSRAGRRATREAAKAARTESASVLLTQARAALTQGKLEDARLLLGRAEQAARTRAEHAEAGTLRAECALVAEQTEAAVSSYLQVATRYADLRAGENALFAAAQLRARGRDPRARALFERYLREHAQGRFADEARARLRTLPAP